MTEPDWEALRAAAIGARDHAYAPYSSFMVGAALQSGSGQILAGCNIENASFGVTICAERVALGAAVSAGERDFDGLAIVTGAATPTPPCGVCRQALVEFSANLRIRSYTEDGRFTEYAIAELLPHAFDETQLP